MKKIAAIILVLALCAVLAACGEMNTINIDPAASPNTITNIVPDPEAPPAEGSGLSGDWYSQQYGLIICLSLDKEGKYVMTMPALDKKTAEGTWRLEDELIYLDDELIPDFSVEKDMLKWIDAEMIFSREMPEVYAPGNVVSARSGDLDGYWKSAYVKLGDADVSAQILDDNTDIYIEGSNVALGGAMLLDSLAKFEFEKGVLSLTLGENADATAIMIQLQDDGMLRLTVGSDGPSVLILEKNLLP